MSIDERVRAYALGYAAERAAATEDAAMRPFLRKIGATHFLRRPDGTLLAFDAYGRERVVHPPRPEYDRWHCERGQNWRPYSGDSEGAEPV
jgi:hypothetical protein